MILPCVHGSGGIGGNPGGVSTPARQEAAAGFLPVFYGPLRGARQRRVSLSSV